MEKFNSNPEASAEDKQLKIITESKAKIEDFKKSLEQPNTLKELNFWKVNAVYYYPENDKSIVRVRVSISWRPYPIGFSKQNIQDFDVSVFWDEAEQIKQNILDGFI